MQISSLNIQDTKWSPGSPDFTGKLHWNAFSKVWSTAYLVCSSNFSPEMSSCTWKKAFSTP